MAAGPNMPPIKIKISKLGDICSICNTSNNEIEESTCPLKLHSTEQSPYLLTKRGNLIQTQIRQIQARSINTKCSYKIYLHTTHIVFSLKPMLHQ